jgi:hypothetical protein
MREYPTAAAAVRSAINGCTFAVAIGRDGGRRVAFGVVSILELSALEATGADFAYLFQRDGQVMTIPVND